MEREVHPLSHGQEALWFLDRLVPGGAAYVIGGAVRLAGELDLGALRRALLAAIERHAALRTCFEESAAGPVQRILAAADLAPGWLREIDGTAWAGREMAERLAALALRPFDLRRGPLLRVTVVRLGPADSILVLVAHHIVADLWSIGILWNEISTLYAAGTAPAPAAGVAARDGGPLPALPALAPLPLRYVDAVARQRRRLAGPAAERHLRYWRERLAGSPAYLDLPTDRPRPHAQDVPGAARMARLPAALGEELARAGEGSLFTCLLACFGLLLARYSGQDDVLIGSPVPGRDAPDLAGLVGYFVNPLVMRCQLDGDPTVRDFVRHLRRSAAGAFRHQGLPFPLLAADLAPERDPGRSPLFQVLFSLQRTPRRAPPGLAGFAMELDGVPLSLGEVPGRSVAFPRAAAEFELALLVAPLGPGAGELAVSLVYRSDLWDETTAERMLAHWLRLVAAAAATPLARLSELALLSAEEKRQALTAWNPAPLPRPPLCLHQLVESSADRVPDAIAVAAAGAALSFGELDRLANRLARRLQRLGVGADTLVGICAERSLAMVVGLLAVLKAGGAYLPLDPENPRRQLALVLEEAKPLLVLVQGSCAELLPPGTAVLAIENPPAGAAPPLAAAPAAAGSLAWARPRARALPSS
ncbi:MAG TPA: condensation domain-containing protein, partial [Thermoanaerobaculia bacterium]|nr:condensation domain-containing protein [Thermoanaerobaculia bacterium]